MTVTDDRPVDLGEDFVAGLPLLPGQRPSTPSERLLASHRIRSWIAVHRTSIPLVIGLLALVASLSAWGVTGSPGRFPDEGILAGNAWAVAEEAAFSNHTYWYDHPPLGQVVVGAWYDTTGALDRAPSAVGAAREVAVIATVLSAALLFIAARRLSIRREFAALAVIAYSLSPLAFEFHRGAFLESLAAPWVLGAIVLALDPRRHLSSYLLAGLCMAGAALTSETALFVVPAVLWLVRSRAPDDNRRYAMVLCTAGALAVLVYPAYAFVKGELLPGPDHVSLWDALWFSATGDGSALGVGTRVDEVLDRWGELDLWLLVGALAVTPLAMRVRSLRFLAIGMLIPLVALLRPGYVPISEVVHVLPFAALLVAAGADLAWAQPNGAARTLRRASVGLVGLVVAVGVAPAWLSGIRDAVTVHDDRELREAVAWVEDNVARSSAIVVDDAVWVDLVRAGFDRDGGVLAYTKFDLDPEIRPAAGLGRAEWLIAEPSLRNAVAAAGDALPLTARLLDESEIVVSFGTGDDVVEVRRRP